MLSFLLHKGAALAGCSASTFKTRLKAVIGWQLYTWSGLTILLATVFVHYDSAEATTACRGYPLRTLEAGNESALFSSCPLCKNPAFAKRLIHYFFLKPLLTFTSWEHRVIVQLMEGTVFHFDAAAHGGGIRSHYCDSL